MKCTTRLALALVALATAACGGSGDGGTPTSPGDGRTVAATPSERFTPASLTVDAGTAVTFAFGSLGHNVFFDAHDGAPANIEGTNANVSVQRTFAAAGTFGYQCHIHPAMRGAVTVR